MPASPHKSRFFKELQYVTLLLCTSNPTIWFPWFWASRSYWSWKCSWFRGIRCGTFVDLLVIIPSTVKETEKRIAIRHSWGKYVDLEGHCERCRSNRTIKILFGVARPEGEDRSIENETEIFQDLALLNLDQQADHYRKLTLKVRSCIEYAVQHFRFSLLLKVDTDSFIFMDRFLLLAEKKKLFGQEFGNPTNIYGGKFLHNHKPNASLASKWTDRTYSKLTGLEYFPAYAHGAGYILSPSLCRYIAEGLSEHAAKSD